MNIDEVMTIIRSEARRLSAGSSSLDPEDIEQDAYVRYLENCASKNIGAGYLRKIVRDVVSSHITDVMMRSSYPVHTPKMVRKALKLVDWDNIRVDINSAFNSLPEGDQRIIVESYTGDMPENNTATYWKLSRAIDKLTIQLNIGTSDRRKAMSNAHAQAEISGGINGWD